MGKTKRDARREHRDTSRFMNAMIVMGTGIAIAHLYVYDTVKLFLELRREKRETRKV